MGNTRDWRESFSQLELAREREQADNSASDTIVGIVALAQPLAEMELILPAAETAPKPKPKAKPKPKGTSKKAANARKPATRKKTVRNPAARKAKSKAAPARQRSAPVKLVETPAIPLPDLSAPLVEPALTPALTVEETVPEALAPLPRKAALAPYRKGGLIEAIGFWLRTTTRRAKAKLGASKALAKSVEPDGAEREIEELKAENERLRRQLDALLTLSDAAQFKFQS